MKRGVTLLFLRRLTLFLVSDHPSSSSSYYHGASIHTNIRRNLCAQRKKPIETRLNLTLKSCDRPSVIPLPLSLFLPLFTDRRCRHRIHLEHALQCGSPEAAAANNEQEATTTPLHPSDSGSTNSFTRSINFLVSRRTGDQPAEESVLYIISRE